ncbi:MAG: c-type cytochrome [Armatimonadetes bacterium]|nr:c-type cytochrome [Armatimonadota bacterium]MDE2207579.1 c-type cytochrome [Armatimonadota bacterium]
MKSIGRITVQASIFMAISVVALVTAAALAAPGPKHRQTPPPPVKTAGEVFKNIKVLNKLPASQLLPMMRKMSDSLGVRCDYCHVEGPNHSGFELDTKKPKVTARAMILMTERLNKNEKILRHQATCYMCHRGSPEPETQLPMPGGRQDSH